MNIRLQQLNPTIGDIKGNEAAILEALADAEAAGVDLLILPEMVVTGYPTQDLLEKEAFRTLCYEAGKRIAAATQKTALLFGNITPNKKGTGRRMFNSALLARGGNVLDVVHKTLLPTYDVFDDLRYFEPNTEFRCMQLDGVALGVTICEDIWYNENEVQYHTYDIDPASEVAAKGAQVLINISASPYTTSKHENRAAMLARHAQLLSLPVLYANQVGAHTEIIFDGDSMALSADGEICCTTRPFHPSHVDVDFDPESGRLIPDPSGNYPTYYRSAEERQFHAIACGLRDYINKTGVTENVVLGLSGGIDSALVCAIAAEVLGPEQVTAITMPSKFSSEGSVSDSEKLARNLGVQLYELPIKELYDTANSTLEPLFEGLNFGVAEENLQSRLRGLLLMAYANKFGQFLLATGNKSEYAVGYATLYGDMNGALAIIGDLYKTEVYALARWMNKELWGKEVIPESIIEKAPSAELRADQKDSDSLPEYDLLDEILKRYIELQESAEAIAEHTGRPDAVKQVIQLTDRNEFKRYQAAPILKLSSKSFGTGRRWPLVQQYTGHEFRRKIFES
ncbi:MAG: NAD+ synthase [Balneolaceae bacterium]